MKKIEKSIFIWKFANITVCTSQQGTFPPTDQKPTKIRQYITRQENFLKN